MAIYAVTIPGRRKRVLVRAANQTEAAARFLDLELLTAEKQQDALEAGETVWREGTPFPPDEPEPETSEEAEAVSE